MPRNLPQELAGEDLAAQRQMIQRRTFGHIIEAPIQKTTARN